MRSMKKVYFMLQWFANGVDYTRSFHLPEERDAFRKRIKRRDWRGHSNVTTWERTTEDTVPFTELGVER